ncbi:hypothetical protein D3C76_1093540 [compost metagenome]
MEGYRLTHQAFTKDEMIAMMRALRGLQSSWEDRQIVGTLDKLHSLIPESMHPEVLQAVENMIVDLAPWGDNLHEKEMSLILKEAILHKLVVQFNYTNSAGAALMISAEPCSVVHKGTHWYMYGYSRNASNFRLFRLSRIRNLIPTDETFDRVCKPYDAAAIEEEWKNTSRTVDLVLRFQSKVKVRVEDSFPADQICYEKDGCMLVQVTYPEDDWVYGTILSYGDMVEVVQPEHVREILGNKARRISELYSRSSKALSPSNHDILLS